MRAYRTGILRAALALLPAALPSCAPALGAPAQQDEANLILLEVRLDRQLLSDSVTAYELGHDVFLPLGEVARLLTLAVRVTGEGRASGYILSEARQFSLDVPGRVFELGGRREALDPAQVRLEADDIYVSSRLLARWLPVDFELDMPSLCLKVRPREQLPLQARLQRHERGTQAGTPGAYADPGYPRLSTPYRLADVPFIDQTVGLATEKRGGQRRTEAVYSAYLTTDLLGMEAALYASRNRDDPAAGLRLTLGRHDPDGELLGPLRARSALFGSILVPGVANVAGSSPTSNGIALSNRPLDQPTSFDRHTLQGALPPGWDVELYYNDALVGYQQSGPSGKYSFDDQPLAYGPNEFRLVFHGPLGQVRVERQSFLLEQSALPRGALFYDLAVQRDRYGRQRAFAQFEWGVSAHLNATAGWLRLPLSDSTRSYANLGLRSYWKGVILTADAIQAENGGKLTQLGVKTSFKGVALAASRARLDNFNSEFFAPTNDPVRTRDELRAEGVLALGAANFFPLSLQLRRDLLASKRVYREAQLRLSAYRDGAAITNALHWQALDGLKRTDGFLQLSRRVAGIGFTGQLQYTLAPQRTLGSATVAADYSLAQGYLLNLGLTRLFRERELRTTAALNKSLGSYGLGLNVFHSNRREYGVGVQFFMAIGREPRSARFFTDAQPLAGTGAASVRVFLDKNLNGTMDGQDEPIVGAGFTVNGAHYGVRTDAAGLAYLPRLPASQHTNIGIDPDTLEDPQWQPRARGVRVVPRPGKVGQVEFPVAVTGEVDGTTYLSAKGVRRPIGDLKLELVDAARKVVVSMTSAADGYYVMTGILPGDYLLRVEPAQLQRLGLVDTGTHSITITAEGSILNGRDLDVRSADDT
jgi:hypothetical protein